MTNAHIEEVAQEVVQMLVNGIFSDAYYENADLEELFDEAWGMGTTIDMFAENDIDLEEEETRAVAYAAFEKAFYSAMQGEE